MVSVFQSFRPFPEITLSKRYSLKIFIWTDRPALLCIEIMYNRVTSYPLTQMVLVANILILFNVLLNPLLYGIYSNDVKQQWKRCLQCCKNTLFEK